MLDADLIKKLFAALNMLAMKCLSARLDGHDEEDIGTLIKHLNIRNAKEVFDIVEKYYPKHVIQPKTQFLIEEMLEEK